MTLIKKIEELKRVSKITIILIIDIFSSIFATACSFIFRLDIENIFFDNLNLIVPFILSLFLFIPIFFILRIYKSIFRYFDLRNLKNLFLAVLIYSIPYFLYIYFFPLNGVPRSIGLIQPIIFFVILFINRMLLITIYDGLGKNNDNKNILIYGAGEAGVQVSKLIANTKNYNIIGFIDDDILKIGRKIYGYNIYSSNQIDKLHKDKIISEVFVATNQMNAVKKIEILKVIEKNNIRTRILPSVDELLRDNININDFRDISVQDLVERRVKVNTDDFIKYFEHETIAITGAGGSIGSQLSLQIIKYKPKKIIIIDNTEYNLYSIEKKLKRLNDTYFQKTEIISSLVDINNKKELIKIFNNHTPKYLFHAAAYKHVPLVENNILEAIRNNIFGTKNLIDITIETKCPNFILISTDKAVRPTNIMGATKRFAEMYVQAANEDQKDKNNSFYSIVRFGNVLDSSGSVVPLFREQINRKGPVTVTHPEVTRYFMTIPEAASLIIKSASIAKGGEIFLLDMGKPVKIIDLAKKMIKLSGYNLDSSSDSFIDIIFTGLRKGEKLHEELFIDQKNAIKISNDIFITKEDYIKFDNLRKLIDDLKKIISESNEKEAILFLKENIKGFDHKENNDIE